MTYFIKITSIIFYLTFGLVLLNFTGHIEIFNIVETIKVDSFYTVDIYDQWLICFSQMFYSLGSLKMIVIFLFIKGISLLGFIPFDEEEDYFDNWLSIFIRNTSIFWIPSLQVLIERSFHLPVEYNVYASFLYVFMFVTGMKIAKSILRMDFNFILIGGVFTIIFVVHALFIKFTLGEYYSVTKLMIPSDDFFNVLKIFFLGHIFYFFLGFFTIIIEYIIRQNTVHYDIANGKISKKEFLYKTILYTFMSVTLLFFTALIFQVFVVNKGEVCNYEGTVTANSLNIRESPDINSYILNTISKGEYVCIKNKTDNWVQLDQGGWVSSKFIKFNHNLYD